jgi:putative transposase
VLYTDHGSDFTSRHLEQVCADLKIRAVFSPPGQPRSRGKVERLVLTVNQMCLPALPGYAPRSTKDRAEQVQLTLSELGDGDSCPQRRRWPGQDGSPAPRAR